MPSIRTWGKLNRSQAPVGSSNEHSSSASSVGASGQEPPSQRFQIPDDQRHLAYGQLPPARDSGQRHSPNLSLDRPPVNVAATVNAAESSPSTERAPDQRYSYQLHSPQHQYSSQEPRKSIRSRIFGSSTRESSDQLSAGSSSANRLARKVSVRKSENLEQNRNQVSPEDQYRLQAQQWQQRQVNNPNLTLTSDRDESNLDPFLQQSGGRSPVDIHVQSPAYQAYQQSHQQDQFQDHLQRPTLARVNTDQSFNTQGDKKYSPDQQSLDQQPPQYQAYSQPDQSQGQSGQYQAFQPAPQVSPLPGQVSLSQQTSDESQHHLYYQHQQQSQQQPQIIQPSQLDDSYLIHQQHQQQQQPFQHQFEQPQQQLTQQQQEFQHQVQQAGRPPSQHQHQARQDHPSQQAPLSQSQQVQDPQLLQSNQQASQLLNPPSPASQHFPPQDPQILQQAPNSPADSGSPSPGQGQMPSSGQQRQSLRPDRTVSRENTTILQNPPQQQGPNQGMAAYGTNVVPQTSQGQPYKGGRQGASDENGSATPDPSIAISEMTEEDVQQLLKEHDVLREKYQKVKRYFFDQQSQVHQLQNTLANQRLSLSRTSLDDSEYATRFNRLEGLISQLAFNLRRSWKTIPHWLQTGVNKDAINIKKQEMTAVGRAFISAWLVDEIFDRFFHPDLEPNLSCQLKSIQNNIRRSAPPAQSIEDEEALTSKIINWRLATIEGLADLLRTQTSSTNRSRLVETLNEKLIAALEMHLEEPAPPDLAGGVPMIIELAIGMTTHLPLESRDVQIEYYYPGHPLIPDLMKIETGIPPLTVPCFDPNDIADKASMNSTASDTKDSLGDQDAGNQGIGGKEEKRSRGMFGGLMAPKKPIPSVSSQQGSSKLAGGGSQVSLTQLQQRPESANGPRDDQPPKVRFSIGMAVQIRGRAVLAKSSVYST